MLKLYLQIQSMGKMVINTLMPIHYIFNSTCKSIKQILKLFKQGHYSMTVYGSGYQMNEGKVKARYPTWREEDENKRGVIFWPLVKPNQS